MAGSLLACPQRGARSVSLLMRRGVGSLARPFDELFPAQREPRHAHRALRPANSLHLKICTKKMWCFFTNCTISFCKNRKSWIMLVKNG